MANELPSLDKECFFIAPIGEKDSEERKRSDGVLRFIVNKAAEEFELKTVRADQIADPGQINLQVIDHLLGARAAVADLTGMNPNVFYEMGIRHTARLPLVLIAESETSLPFDFLMMRTIFFNHTDLESSDECRVNIVAQLRQALEKGVVDSPVATSVDVTSMSRGSALERSVAELVTTVEELSRSQREVMLAVSQVNVDSRRHFVSTPPGLLRDLSEAASVISQVARESGDARLVDVLMGLDRPISYLRDSMSAKHSSSTVRAREALAREVRRPDNLELKIDPDPERHSKAYPIIGDTQHP